MKGDNERLPAVEHRTIMRWIPAPVGLDSETSWSRYPQHTFCEIRKMSQCMTKLTTSNSVVTEHRYPTPTFFSFPTAVTLKTRGPWWSYIAHLTKQICIFTVEVSAKNALGFLYKLYSTNHPQPPPPHPRPCFFTNLDNLNCILKEGHQRNISAKLYWNWSSGLRSFI